jgi:hypothetical protein
MENLLLIMTQKEFNSLSFLVIVYYRQPVSNVPCFIPK